MPPSTPVSCQWMNWWTQLGEDRAQWAPIWNDPCQRTEPLITGPQSFRKPGKDTIVVYKIVAQNFRIWKNYDDSGWSSRSLLTYNYMLMLLDYITSHAKRNPTHNICKTPKQNSWWCQWCPCFTNLPTVSQPRHSRQSIEQCVRPRRSFAPCGRYWSVASFRPPKSTPVALAKDPTSPQQNIVRLGFKGENIFFRSIACKVKYSDSDYYYILYKYQSSIVETPTRRRWQNNNFC